jgi:hypothetical protein
MRGTWGTQFCGELRKMGSGARYLTALRIEDTTLV